MEHDEMRQLAGQEIQTCKSRLMTLQDDIKDALIPKDEADEHAAIVEIRAGKSLKSLMYIRVKFYVCRLFEMFSYHIVKCDHDCHNYHDCICCIKIGMLTNKQTCAHTHTTCIYSIYILYVHARK